jgi:hypothetical protein
MLSVLQIENSVIGGDLEVPLAELYRSVAHRLLISIEVSLKCFTTQAFIHKHTNCYTLHGTVQQKDQESFNLTVLLVLRIIKGKRINITWKKSYNFFENIIPAKDF